MRTIIACIVVLGISTLVAVSGFLLVDRIVPMERRHEHNDVAGFVYAVIAPLYAIQLAFVVFVVWGNYQEAQSQAVDEAVAVRALYGLAQGIGGDQGVAIERAPIAYGQSVVRDEWPAMSRGSQSIRTSQALDDLRNQVDSYNPQSARGSGLYQQALSDMHDVRVNRGRRVNDAQSDVHPVLWIGLIAGAVITIVFSYFFGTRDRTSHAFMVGVLTVSVVGILFMIDVINGPYRGDVSVRPVAMTESIAAMQNGLLSGVP
jgi:phosphotransferase system  glucose/maltose/N-acetylglucosamine-specific IIC component